MELASSVSLFEASIEPRFSFVGRRSPSLLKSDKLWFFAVLVRRELNTAKPLKVKVCVTQEKKRKVLITQTKRQSRRFYQRKKFGTSWMCRQQTLFFQPTPCNNSSTSPPSRHPTHGW